MKRSLNFKWMGFALLISLFSLNISAQGPGGPGRGPQMTEDDIKARAEQTAKALDLSETQHEKILAIDMDFYNKMQIERQKMRNAGGPPPDREAMRARMTKMFDERNAQYKGVLTEEQYNKFIQLQEQRRSEMREQRQQGNPPPGGAEARPERGRGRN